MSSINDTRSATFAWDIACRWRQYEAELRVNVLRIIAVGLFYLVHLAHYHAADGASWLAFLQMDGGTKISPNRHLAITAVAVAWTMWAFAVHFLLQDRVFPRRLPVVSIVIDSTLLTAILTLSNGAASPLVAGYFLIIIMAGLRLNLGWIWLATGSAMAGYLFVLGCTKWPRGLLLEQPLPHVPRYHQVMVILALVLAGLVVGQSVRHIRRVVNDIARVSQQGPGE